MKTKNLIIILCIVLASMLANVGYASSRSSNFVPVEELYSEVSCENISKLYLNEDNDGDGLADVFYYLNSNFSLSGTIQSHTAGQIMREHQGNIYTKVKYYTPLQHMLYKIDPNNQTGLIDDYTFWRASWVFPYNTSVRGIATTPNKVIFEQPSDNNPNKNIISIVYDYKYKYALGFDGTSFSEYRYHQVPDITYMGNTYVELFTTLPGSQGNRKRNWSSVESFETCRNYELSRCGDEKIDIHNNSRVNQFTGEVCDDGPNNGLPGYCNATCSGPTDDGIGRCGDGIHQLEGTSPYDNEINMSFEECDHGDPGITNELNNGINNGDDPSSNFCMTSCTQMFVEEFVEEFINQ